MVRSRLCPSSLSAGVALALLAACVAGADAEDKTLLPGKRDGKFLSVFQIVRFNNDPCEASDKNGTCYTAQECESRGGTNDGDCADGFGVCCTFTLHCGQSASENCTYFESESLTAGGCQAEICPCNDNICQIRLDFVNFVISGPSTSTVSVTTLTNGVAVGGGTTGVTDATQCLTDTFSVVTASATTPPVICGTNSGEHMYVDAGKDSCNTLSFTFGTAATTNRAFNIKVTQFTCDFHNLAPQGCTQYFYGAQSGTIESYNYNNGNGRHLADQDQQICIRRERSYCRICYYAVNFDDFDVSGTIASMGHNDGDICCAYPAAMGFDCVNIPGAETETSGNPVGSNVCGMDAGLVTAATTGTAGAKSICTTLTPFVINFRTDAWEYQAAEAGFQNTGFQLGYFQDSDNC